MVKLTDQQREQLKASHGQPVMVEDDEAHKVYFLVDADYLHTNHQRLKTLIAEGINSKHVAAEIAEVELQSYADQLDIEHA